MGHDSESGAPASSPYKPRQILAGRYQVRREIGRGGMGIVYLCRDLIADERVALKLLIRPGMKMRPEDAWWFQEEARALASLSHPAIVRARDFGTLEDGTPYLAMDAVPGRSLHEWIYLAHTDGLLPWPIVWTTVDQVLGALAHAHARGVIHGDLKPSNVLLDVPPDGAEPTAHVLDLGLAWLMQDRVDHRLDGGQEAEPTVRWGAGTPGWMAPEQIRFAAPHIGPPTDLYALGCILFALLSDREPYTGTNEELLAQHKSGPVPEPKIPPGVPQEAAPFVMRLMAKRPWHRFEYAADARRAWRRLAPAGGATSTPLPLSSLRRGPLPSATAAASSREAVFAGEPLPTTTGLLSLRPAPFVARGFERAHLLEIAADVVERGGHRLVLLAGDAGVGKSRLAEWLCEEVHERGMMVPLRARYRKIAAPLDGIIGAVTAHYRLERADRDIVEKVLMNLWEVPANDEDEKTWVAATAEWIRPASYSDGVRAEVAAGAPTPQSSRERPGYAAGPSGKRFALDRPELRWLIVRRALERIGHKRPVLLWMDDLHHAAASTIDGLLALHRDAPHLGLMIVATVRNEAAETDPQASALIDTAMVGLRGERLDVAPLSPQQTHGLLRDTLPLDDAAVIEAAARSKGNPLFALQLLHAWAMGGHMELKGGRYVVPKESLEVRAGTTADLWEERLRALPEALRRGAIAAAALGGDIRNDVLTAELAALGIDPDAAILAMKRAQILLATADRLRWPHALLQEHLLAQIHRQPDAATIFRAAAAALARHPTASSRRIVRHRVVNLLRAGALAEAATLLHQHTAQLWGKTRDASATLRDLALLDRRLEGAEAATHQRWRAEALRHEGRIEEARREAEEARRLFEDEGDAMNQAQCLRLLGHIASDLGAPAQGRRLVMRANAIFEEHGDEPGQAQCEVVIGEIDFLLGDHATARQVLSSASERFLKAGDWLGRAQCLLLQGWVEQSGGSPTFARELMRTARADFDAIGYRLGIAQCDLTLAHADHRDGDLVSARAGALGARQSFRDLANPRGEAGSERLLSMVALDAGSASAAEEHARSAGAIYARLSDPWGEVETRLVYAQIALDRGDADAARDHLIACEAFALAEAEPKQHRHLTLAWLAYHEGRFQDAAREIDQARASFKDASRTADHTPQLLERFARMGWPKPASTRVSAWRRAIGRPGPPVAPRRAAPDSTPRPGETTRAAHPISSPR